MLGLLLLTALHASPCEGAKVSLVSFTDLPRDDARSHNLSGLVWDDATKQLFAVSDKDPWLVTLTFDPRWTHAQLGPVLKLTDVPLLSRWDGEALARLGEGWLISDEAGPNLYVVDKSGRITGTLPEPAKLRRARFNLGIEGLAVLDGGKTLLLAVEQSLEEDGAPATSSTGTTVRFFRRQEGKADTELAYRTDPAYGRDGDVGVSELAVAGPELLLVLERAYAKGKGNRVRVYCTRPTGADVGALEHLGPETKVLEKRLLVDLATLPPSGANSPDVQASPLLDNYEGLAVGPRLPDGRRLLFLVSDDNTHDNQVPRLLVLAVEGL